MSHDDSGWDRDDPEYVAARVTAVVDSMARRWRGRRTSDIEAELARRLAPMGDAWPPELLEHLSLRIADPHWPWKHPRRALDLSRRYHARARAETGESRGHSGPRTR